LELVAAGFEAAGGRKTMGWKVGRRRSADGAVRSWRGRRGKTKRKGEERRGRIRPPPWLGARRARIRPPPKLAASIRACSLARAGRVSRGVEEAVEAEKMRQRRPACSV